MELGVEHRRDGVLAHAKVALVELSFDFSDEALSCTLARSPGSCWGLLPWASRAIEEPFHHSDARGGQAADVDGGFNHTFLRGVEGPHDDSGTGTGTGA